MLRNVSLITLLLVAGAAFAADSTSPVTGKAIPATSFAPVVRQVAPSIVTVLSSHIVHGVMGLPPDLPNDLGDDPALQFFFGGRDRNQQQSHKEQGLGSGVIVSADGYILTNNHVVEKADEIKVSLAGSNEEYLAKVIGTDAKTDLAVLKIDPAGKSLPAAVFADSDRIEVGDLALAIGNPFGVGQTVTMGIISAVGRGVGIADYEDFLQTDASINPGNSGGALVDFTGKVMGINTAIFSPNGGNLGIGFAVPANLAHAVAESIIAKGKVVRGYLGLMLQPLNMEMAKAFKTPNDHGVLVGDVLSDGPSAKAGIKPGDVITAYNDSPITDVRHLRLLVARTPPGVKVSLTVLRDGSEQKIDVILQDQSLARNQSGDGIGSGSNEEVSGKSALGVKCEDLSDSLRKRFDIPDKLYGAVIVEVRPGTHAEAAGLKPGDVIMEVNRILVTSAKAAENAIRDGKGDQLLLRVWSQGGGRYVMVKMNG